MQRKGPLGHVVDFAGRVASYFFLIVVVITAYEVVMRYAFKAPTIWVHEITEVLAAAAFVIGGPYVHAARRHISITYFYERMPSSVQGIVTLLISVLTLVFLFFLSYAAIDQAMVSIRDMETSGTALNTHSPMFLKILFAVACVVLTLQTIGHVLVDIIAMKERQK